MIRSVVRTTQYRQAMWHFINSCHLFYLKMYVALVLNLVAASRPNILSEPVLINQAPAMPLSTSCCKQQAFTISMTADATAWWKTVSAALARPTSSAAPNGEWN
jgi:hypothetical protein